MNYQDKYRNNPALRLFLLYTRKFLTFTILLFSLPFLLIPEKAINRHKSLKNIYTFFAYLIAYLNLDDYEKFINKNYPRKKILADYSDLN